ncbi:MAG: hypothetical protein A3E87_10080 [Gammaproteobacteria bacterium RIFCSPHIGHO2_12_FULL_35_23]|nr:MAG: hypothetical protein A3E87_10080 [Gammaproteobacteria bacterium RIFCSPHIGHO2_12_FULL_35_23]
MRQANNHDTLQKFSFEKYPVRGVIIHLNATFKKACESSNYSEATKKYLGTALSAIGLLSSTIKYEGKLTLQIQGEGPLSLLLTQANEKLQLRGLAHEKGKVTSSFKKSIVKGTLLINIDLKDAKNRYQAVTELKQETLAEAINHYFMQSEQLPTKLWLFANKNSAAGLLIQKMPSQEAESEFWEHIVMLAETITAKELLSLSNYQIINRLFHEEAVRLFEQDPVCFKCSCSNEKMAAIIIQLGEKEAEEILAEQGEITATCDFCNRIYRFDKVDVAKLFTRGNIITDNETKQ